MILTDSRSLEWIDHVATLYPILNKTLIEKSIRAFSLLESLARSGCPFCFKGGTAIMLMTDSSRRLSIDIDIICPPGTDVAKYVNTYAADYGFSNIQLTERKSANNVPKSHAKYFYQVSYVTNTKPTIFFWMSFSRTCIMPKSFSTLSEAPSSRPKVRM